MSADKAALADCMNQGLQGGNALHDPIEFWLVFRISPTGRAEAANVVIGRMNADMAEVRGGLDVGDRVIVHPGDKVADGGRVSAPHR